MNVLLIYAAMVLLESDVAQGTAVDDAFKEASIVPDIIPVSPKSTLVATFKEDEVNLGNTIYATKTINIPTLKCDIDIKNYYTFMMISPDVPSAKYPVFCSYLITLHVNIINVDLKSGSEIAKYFPLNPMTGSGLQRCILLLYKQNQLIDTKNKNLLSLQINRLKFSVADFTKRYHLSYLVAGNFYMSELFDKATETSDTISNITLKRSSNMLSEKQSAKPSDNLSDKKPVKSIDKQAIKQPAKLSDKPSDKKPFMPTNRQPAKPSDNKIVKPFGKPSVKQSSETLVNQTNKLSLKLSCKTSTKIWDQSSEESLDESSNKPSDESSDESLDVSLDESSGKSLDESSEEPSGESLDESSGESLDESPGEKNTIKKY